MCIHLKVHTSLRFFFIKNNSQQFFFSPIFCNCDQLYFATFFFNGPYMKSGRSCSDSHYLRFKVSQVDQALTKRLRCRNRPRLPVRIAVPNQERKGSLTSETVCVQLFSCSWRCMYDANSLTRIHLSVEAFCRLPLTCCPRDQFFCCLPLISLSKRSGFLLSPFDDPFSLSV